jgi:hypothetical protein
VEGYYGNTEKGVCVECDKSCKTCGGLGPAGCLSCNKGYIK